MEYVTLGKTGLKISRLGFGGIPIQRVDAAVTKELAKAMVEKGINYIDTARGYTVSESYIGEALEGIRDKFVLATKSMARTKEAMAADIETSLKNLRTDYIDLYQIHNPNMEQLEQVISAGGALEALQEAKAAGKIGHIGLTAHSLEVFEKAMNNIMPVLEVKARRVGGATYQVPLEIRPERRQTLGLRWLVTYARNRHEKTMAEKLAGEILDAIAGNGGAVKKKEDTHRMAEANKAFAHYRW